MNAIRSMSAYALDYLARFGTPANTDNIVAALAKTQQKLNSRSVALLAEVDKHGNAVSALKAEIVNHYDASAVALTEHNRAVRVADKIASLIEA